MKEDKKKRGRPATGKNPLIASRMDESFVSKIDSWANAQSLSRSKAIRKLIQIGLAESLPNDFRELVKKPLDTPTAEEIRQLRKESSLTQSELGEIAGTTGQAVKQWEAGEYQPRPAVWRFIEVYIFLKKNNFL